MSGIFFIFASTHKAMGMKKLFVLVLTMMMFSSLYAEHVENRTAMTVAKTILPHSNLSDISNREFNHLYVFTDDHSFVIVSADDRVTPILGYSEEFPFVMENMPMNIRSWMDGLNAAIQESIDHNLAATEEINRDWNLLKNGIKPEPKNRSSVTPLIKTHWDQGTPYNNLCPGGSVTGCTATAMAQIMKYWEWPKTGIGSHSYEHPTYGTIYANFGETTYDWDNMIAITSTSATTEQQDAVATLMYHCGVSVDMNYSPSASAAYLSTSSFVDYFGYNQSDIRTVNNQNISASEWIMTIENEINNGRPVLYAGWNEEGTSGHSFVCDGYDENDYFHINWGWSGSCDGYYAYGAMNPGNNNFSGFNIIIFGLHPDTPPISTPTNLTVQVAGSDVSLNWSPVNEADHYKVYCDGFVVDANVDDTLFTYIETEYGIIERSFYVKAVNSDGFCSLRSNEVKHTIYHKYSSFLPTNLTAVQDYHNVRLDWNPPYNPQTYFKYADEGPYFSNINFNESQFYGQRYTDSTLFAYRGLDIVSVQVNTMDYVPYTLYIYKIVDGDMVLQTTQDLRGQWGWVTIDLDSPVAIDDGNDIMIVFHSRDYTGRTGPTYVGCFDSDNASLYSTDGMSYEPYGRNVSWMMRIFVADGAYTYDVFRNGEMIANHVDDTTFVDYGLDTGVYSYTVKTNCYGGQSGMSEEAIIEVMPIPTYTVTVAANPDDGGTVTGGGTFEEGALVMVSAMQNVGYLFDKWTEDGELVSTDAEYAFLLSGDRDLEAVFKENDLTVHVLNVVPALNSESDDGQVTVFSTGGVPPYIYELDGKSSLSTSDSYTFSNVRMGTYSLSATDDTGYSVSISVVVSSNGVGEDVQNVVQLYPNPTNDKITIVCEGLKSITIVSPLGQQLGNVEVNDGRAIVDMSTFNEGTYLFVIHKHDGAILNRMVIKSK